MSAPAAPSASAKPAAANRSDPEPAAAPQKQADKGTAPAAAAASSSQGSQNGSSSGTDTHRAVTVNESVVGEHKAATDLSRAETVRSVATDDPAASQPATVAATTAVPPTPQDAPPKPAPLPTRQASPVVAATKAVEEPSVQPPVTLSRPRTTSSITAISRDKGGAGAGVLGLSPNLWKKIGLLVALVAASRVGVYDRLPGVDVAKFSEAVSSNGLLGYLDSITGGSISNVGVCSLGIIPAINASIFLQILTITFPGLKKLQREEGPQGRARYQLYQKLATLAFATAQAFGQLTAIKCVSFWQPQRCCFMQCRTEAAPRAPGQCTKFLRQRRRCGPCHSRRKTACAECETAPPRVQGLRDGLLARLGGEQHVCARRGRDDHEPDRGLHNRAQARQRHERPHLCQHRELPAVEPGRGVHAGAGQRQLEHCDLSHRVPRHHFRHRVRPGASPRRLPAHARSTYAVHTSRRRRLEAAVTRGRGLIGVAA